MAQPDASVLFLICLDYHVFLWSDQALERRNIYPRIPQNFSKKIIFLKIYIEIDS